MGRSLGWQELPSPTWCCSFKAGLAVWQVPGRLRPSFLLLATGLATSLSTLPGISPPSSLCPQPVWGGDRATLAASGRNRSDRGCGEGRIGLAYEARAVPEAPVGQAPPRWGPRAPWEQGCHSGGLPRSPPSPVVPAPAASSTARLGVGIKGGRRRPSEQPLAPSVLAFRVRHWLDPPQAPTPGPPGRQPWEAWSGPAIPQHARVGPTPGAPGLPLGGGPLGRPALRTFRQWEPRLRATWSLGLMGAHGSSHPVGGP